MKYLLIALLIASNAQAKMTKEEYFVAVYSTVSFILFDKACEPNDTDEKISDKCLDALNEHVETVSKGLPEK